MATLYSDQVVHSYGDNNRQKIEIDLSYSASRSGTTQNYSFSGTVKKVVASGWTSWFDYNIKVYITVNGTTHKVYDKTTNVGSNTGWSYSMGTANGGDTGGLDFSVANKTSGTTPFSIEVYSAATGDYSGFDWTNSTSLPITPYVVAPTYNSISASVNSSSSVTLTASINNGGGSITAGGWQLSTDGTNWTTYANDWASKTITSLTRATGYSYRGYATNSAGTTYSSASSFSTPAESPVLVINSISNISDSSADIVATCTDTGGKSLVTSTISVATDSNFTNVVCTINSLSGTATGLSPNTLYYVEAKASNADSAGYSSVSTFTTTAQIPILYLSEDKRVTPSQATHIDIPAITFKTILGFDLDFRYNTTIPQNQYKHIIGIGGGSTNALLNLSFIMPNGTTTPKIQLTLKKNASSSAASLWLDIDEYCDPYSRNTISWRVDSNGVGTLKINGIVVETLSDIDTTFANANKPLCLLNNAELYTQGDTRAALASIFNVKFYEYDTLMHDFVPYESGGVAYLRDIVPATPVDYTGNNLVYVGDNAIARSVFLAQGASNFTNVTNKIELI